MCVVYNEIPVIGIASADTVNMKSYLKCFDLSTVAPTESYVYFSVKKSSNSVNVFEFKS